LIHPKVCLPDEVKLAEARDEGWELVTSVGFAGKVSGEKKSNISICITVNMEDICKVKSKKKKEDGNQEA